MITEKWVKQVLNKVAYRGPLPQDYAAVTIAVEWIYNHTANPSEWMYTLVVEPHRRYAEVRDMLANGILRKPYDLLLHIWDKPRGFNGDGDLLQKMYDCLGIPDYDEDGRPCATHVKSRWDHYISARPEMLSLQHRKHMFEEQLESYINQGATSLIDLGCGNGSYADYAWWKLKAAHPIRHRVVGVDNDRLPNRVWVGDGPLYVKQNVLNDLPKGQFDIVYSGGLFDYFNDKMFTRMLDRCLDLNPRFIMIGNIEQTPSTKAFMSCMRWNLFDRSRLDLLQLTINHFPAPTVRVDTDNTGCQHFLKVTL